MCSLNLSHEYLQLPSNGVLPHTHTQTHKKEQSDQPDLDPSRKRYISHFFHIVLSGEFHMGCFLTLFHPHVAQECILEVQWIKMPCQRGNKKENLHSELSVIPPSFLYHGKLVKSSPSSHKLAGRFISRLTFSLEMPPGTWASALWREMTGLLLEGGGSGKLFSRFIPLLSLFYFSHSYSFILLMRLFKTRWQPLKRQRPRLTSVYFTLLISISFHFIIFKFPQDNPGKSSASGENAPPDSWKVWRSLGFKNIRNSNYLALSPLRFFFPRRSDTWIEYSGGKTEYLTLALLWL